MHMTLTGGNFRLQRSFSIYYQAEHAENGKPDESTLRILNCAAVPTVLRNDRVTTLKNDTVLR
jgi:hypothetical protein